MAISLVKDLFGSVLFLSLSLSLSLKQRIDMGEILKYPLTQVPLSLTNFDGSIKKIPKAKLLKELESRVASVKRASIDLMIIDAMFFLNLLVDPPSTFGSIARYMLGCICSTTSREIHFVLDKIIHPSIKDCERDARSLDRSNSCNIIGSSQKRPDNWLAALSNDHFKSSLIQYLISAWDDDSLATTLGEKKLFVNNNYDCYSFTVKDERMCKMCERRS